MTDWEIIAHRGFWKEAEEKNSWQAFERAFKTGYGIETDIRDQNGHLVISHDPPVGQCIEFDAFLDLYEQHDRPGMLALNIKADGLQHKCKESLARRAIGPDHYFFFDMSIPDAYGFTKHRLSIYSRHSDLEPTPHLLDLSDGVVLDCFNKDWITPAHFQEHLNVARSVMLISPELHGRDPATTWELWQSAEIGTHKSGSDARLLLCTDRPDEAKEMFVGRKDRSRPI